MLYELIVIYLAGWFFAAVGLYAFARHYADRRSPARHSLWMSIGAGALWPLLLIGMVEWTTAAVYAKTAKTWAKDDSKAELLV